MAGNSHGARSGPSCVHLPGDNGTSAGHVPSFLPMIRPLLSTMRPKQWVKNLFVVAPLVFARRVSDLDSVILTVAAVAIFCMVSSSVYILNDLQDIEKDRAHPKKRARPLPAGTLPTRVAWRAFAVLAAGSLSAGFFLSVQFGLATAAYLVMNIGYSFGLKRIAYLDVLFIALGFLIRVWAGAAVLTVSASWWLMVCTGVLAMYLGFGKRAHELITMDAGHRRSRESLAGYNPAALEWILHALGSITVTIYVLYTQSEHVQAVFGDVPLLYTIPFPMFGILRFSYLVTNRPDSESPTEEMLRDPLFITNLVLWGLSCVLVVYDVL